MAENKTPLTDEQLTQKLKSGKRGKAGAKLLIGIGGAVFLAGVILGTSIPLIVFGVVIAGIGAKMQEKTQDDARQSLNDTVIQDALDAAFENAVLKPTAHFSQKTIEESGIPLPSYNYGPEGGNFVEALYRGKKVELSNIRLLDRGQLQREETGQMEECETVAYEGQWLRCELGVSLPSDIKIYPRGKLDKILRTATIKTENKEFDSRYNLVSDDEASALCFFDPKRIEQFLTLANTSGGALSVSALRGGTLFLAVSSRSFFDPGKYKETAGALRERFTRELRWFTDMIDVFCPTRPQ